MSRRPGYRFARIVAHSSATVSIEHHHRHLRLFAYDSTMDNRSANTRFSDFRRNSDSNNDSIQGRTHHHPCTSFHCTMVNVRSTLGLVRHIFPSAPLFVSLRLVHVSRRGPPSVYSVLKTHTVVSPSQLYHHWSTRRWPTTGLVAKILGTDAHIM